MTYSGGTVLWDVLGVVPFGEDDRSGARELLVLVGCACCLVAVLSWTHQRHRPPEEVADAVGSVFAVGALVCELASASRLFWVLLAAALGGGAAVRLVREACPMCVLTGRGGHAAAHAGRRAD